MTGRKLSFQVLVLFLFTVGAGGVSAQVEWAKDASGAKIPAGPVSGQVDGKTIAPLKFGHLDTAGKVGLGSPDLSFVHYKISLQDAEMFYDAKVFADVTVTVRKGELPDGKTFRRTSASWEEQPSIRGEGYRLPEFHSLDMKTRKMSMREQKPSESSHDAWLTNSAFTSTGRVEFDKRKADKITVRLYVCFDDPAKSCLAGAAEIQIR